MQRLGIVAIPDELVGNLLRLHTGAAEDDGIDFGVVVCHSLEGIVLVACADHVVDVVDVLCPLVAATHHNFLGIVEVVFGDAFNLLAHGGREEQGVALGRHSCKDGVDAFGEAHVEHLVSLVEHHILHGAEVCHFALHEVDQSARGGNDDLHPLLQGTNLGFDAGTAIDSQHVQPIDVFGVVFQIVGYLQTQLTGGCHDDRLHLVAAGVYLLQHRQTVCGCLARACLGKSHHIVVVTEQVGYHLLLHRHGADIAHLLNGSENLSRHTQFFKRRFHFRHSVFLHFGTLLSRLTFLHFFHNSLQSLY